jgi:hypothetical protein
MPDVSTAEALPVPSESLASRTEGPRAGPGTSPTVWATPLKLNEEQVHLLNVFRSGLAVWMDVFDSSQSHQREVVRRAMYSDLLLNCICAFTAKNLSLLPSGKVWQPVAAQFYSQV